MGDYCSSLLLVQRLKAEKVVLCLLILCKFSTAAVLYDDLFPVSESNEETENFAFWNSVSREVKLGFIFQYSTVNYTSIHINSNGVLSFGQRSQRFWYYTCTDGERVTHEPVIAVFWARLNDTSQNGGQILYQSTQHPYLLDKAASDIFYAFPQENRNLTNLFIITWKDVIPRTEHGTGQNTFQVVLATDGVRSFILFYFNQIQWPKQLKQYKVICGFFSRSDVAPYLLTGSCTDHINEVVVNKSNMNAPGKWVFRVDTLEVQENGICNDVDKRREEWSQNVQFASLLGKGALIFRDRCIDLYNYQTSTVLASCSFVNLGDKLVVGESVANSGIICEIPYLNNLGLIEVTVLVIVTHGDQRREIQYKFPLSVVRSEDLADTANFRVSKPEREIILIQANWSAEALSLNESLLGALNKRDLAFVLLERFGESSWSELELKTWSLDHSAVSLTSHSHQFTSSELLHAIHSRLHPIFGVRYQVTLQSGMIVSKMLVSDVLVAERVLQIVETKEYNHLSSLKCKHFCEEETDPISIDVTRCPDSALQAAVDFTFTRDYFGESLMQSPEPIRIFSHLFSNFASSQTARCSYDKNGDKIVGAPNGDRFDYFSQYDVTHVWSHYDMDILPDWYCCRESANATDLCQQFYNRRNLPTQKGKTVTPNFAIVFGLGHINSFGSSESFTINGITGIVWLAKFQNKKTKSAFQIQGYFVPFRQTSSTKLKAVAIRDIFQDQLVTVECSAGHKPSTLFVTVKVGSDTEFRFEERHLSNRTRSRVYHESIHILKETTNSVIVIFKSGFAVNVVLHESLNESWLSVVVQDSTPLTKSLVLSWGYLYQNSNVNVTSLNYGVQDGESIFLTKLEIKGIQTSVVVPSTEYIQVDFHGCDKQSECLFDFRMTGDFTFARITRESRQQHQRILNAFSLSTTVKTDTKSDFTFIYIGISSIIGIVLVIALVAAVNKYKTGIWLLENYHGIVSEEDEPAGLHWEASVVYRK